VCAVDPLIRARGLVKRFGGFTAVDGIDFDLQRGEAFGFLGPNGAGKSSTMRMIGCVSPPSAGELSILGLDPVRDGREIRARLGVVPQEDTLDAELTVRENLLIYGRYFGLPRDVIRERTARLLEFVQLSDRADDQVEPLSGGMKRRLTIARSLINEPDVMLLDEPTTGLDPRSRIELWDAIRSLVNTGTDVLLTTQYLDEADHLASQVVIIDHGKSVATGSPTELKRQIGGDIVELHVRNQRDLARVAELLGRLDHGQTQIDEPTRRVSVRVRSGGEALMAALRSLEASGVELEDIAMRQPNLDEVFLLLTGRPTEDSGSMAARAA
jgi:lipooligosaccharide transport system ATP-binding protein